MRWELLLAVVFVGLAVFPGATAQVPGLVDLLDQTTTTVSISPLAQPVKPLGPIYAIPVEVTYSFESVMPETSSTQVDLSVRNSPPWAITTLSPSSVFFNIGVVPSLHWEVGHAQAVLLVSATADAPAFMPSQIEVTAEARPNGFYLPSSGRAQTVVTPDFFPLTDARLESQRLGLGPSHARDLLMNVTNFGNGAVRVHFDVESAPEGVSVTPPGPVMLESRQWGGVANGARVAWRVATTSGFRDGDVVFRVHTAYALDPAVAGEFLKLVLRVEHGDDSGDARVQMLGLDVQGTTGSALASGTMLAAVAVGILHWRRRGG